MLSKAVTHSDEDTGGETVAVPFLLRKDGSGWKNENDGLPILTPAGECVLVGLNRDYPLLNHQYRFRLGGIENWGSRSYSLCGRGTHDRGARTHNYKIKSLALYRLS